MIDKERTIKRARAKYGQIFPYNARHDLEDCFFCLRGKFYFQFRTKDKKVHTLKALPARAPAPQIRIQWGEFDPIVKILTQPINLEQVPYLRVLFTPIRLDALLGK